MYIRERDISVIIIVSLRYIINPLYFQLDSLHLIKIKLLINARVVNHFTAMRAGLFRMYGVPRMFSPRREMETLVILSRMIRHTSSFERGQAVGHLTNPPRSEIVYTFRH